MNAFRWAIAFWLALGLLAFAGWTVRVFVTQDLAKNAGWTSWLVYRCGQGFVWLGALLSAGVVVGVAARAAWELLGR